MSGGLGSKLATSMTSGGGISPQQQAFANYTMGEQSIKGASDFGNSGIPVGTGETWASTVGPSFQGAKMEAQMSDADAAAMQKTLSSKFSSAGQGVGQLGGALGGKGGG